MDHSLCQAAIIGDTQSLSQLMQTDPLILDKFLAGCFHCRSPLHVATSNSQTLFVKQLLRLKPKLAKVLDLQQWSVLHLASDEGQDEIVKELIDVSPEMCLVRNRDGNNPLHLAAIKGNVGVLELLVQTNPLAARVRVDQNETILHLCVKHGKLSSLELLLRMIQSQAFVNAKDNDGNNILHIAILGNRYEIANHVLMNNKIDVNERNGSGFTAMDILFRVNVGPNHKELVHIEDRLRLANAVRGRDTVAGEWITKVKDSLMVVASLMAAMAFQAGVSPPGGVWQDDSNEHRAGEAVMAYNYAHSYPYFIQFNTVGFVASLTTIFFLLTSGVLFPNKAATMWILTMTMWLAITSMAMTYAFSNVVVTPKKEWQSLSNGIVIAILVWCSIMVLLLLRHTLRLAAIVLQERKRAIQERSGAWSIVRKIMGLNVGGESLHLALTS